MQNEHEFPLKGVIGIVANSINEIDQAQNRGLGCVEIRADLLLDNGLSVDQLMQTVKRARTDGLAVLFTLRHPTHGGTFNGDETTRADLSRQALDAGANLVDLEWDTEAAALLQDQHRQLILSYHNFEAMPDNPTLAQLTSDMCKTRPRAIKVVPTATTLNDAVRMLQWVSDASDDVRRIGFAMGSSGACSRLLTLCFGGPITYASFGAAVAPGQIDMDTLLDNYRAQRLNTRTELMAVHGANAEQTTTALNTQYTADGINRVAVSFADVPADDLQNEADALHIAEIVS